MRVLVYGAGVIGCYLTHVLCQAGNDVTLLARGSWKLVLETKGLTIRHHLQRKTTTDYPHIIGQVDFSRPYDVVFSVMPYHQVGAILDDLAAVDADTVVLVGNNLSALDMEQYLKAHIRTEKNLLFGFQVTACGGMTIWRAFSNAMWRQSCLWGIWPTARTVIIRKLQRSSGSCAWTPPLRAMTCS